MLLRRLLVLEPANSAALELLAMIAFEHGDAKAAARNLVRALAIVPGHANSHINRGLSLLALGRHREAVQSLMCGLALGPEERGALIILGDAFLKAGAYADAVNCYQRVITPSESDVGLLHRLGIALGYSGRLSEAEQALGRALALAGKDAATVAAMAELLQRQGLLSKAEALLQQAIKDSPTELKLRRQLAQCMEASGRSDLALRETRRILELAPQDDEAWRSVYRFEAANRRWPQALDAACRAVALNPAVPQGHALRTRSMSSLHQSDNVESVLRTWLTLSPNDSGAHSEFAASKYLSGQTGVAELHWRLGLEIAEARARSATGIWVRQRILRDVRPVSRLGELAKTLDIFIKTGVLGWREPFRGIVAGVTGPRTNSAFLDCWREHVDIVTDLSIASRLFADPGRVVFPTQGVRIGNGRVLHNDRAYHAVELAWREAGHGPVLKLRDEHRDHGLRQLSARGMPRDAWFVVLHIREDGFHNTHYRNLRSCLPASYVPAIQRIAAHGGWVCRIGDPSMSPLPSLPNLIDVTPLDPRDGMLDVFLVAAARFMVATASGPLAMAICFGTPQLLTNVYPVFERAWSGHDRFMPKIYRDLSSGQMMPFQRAINGLTAAAGDDVEGLKSHNLAVVDNTADEIVDAVEDMLAMTAGQNPENAATVALQNRYDSYCHARLPYFSSRIAGSFIRRHAGLLQ
jgi:putative glycosyltransferase (TIGR04372 family)